MDSIRKLVSENESNRKTFQIVSRFLKEMGWWTYWKEYITTDRYKTLARNFPNGNWVECENPYNVFGSTNFSGYLEAKHNIHLMTVLDIFIVYTYYFCPKLFASRGSNIDDAIRGSRYAQRKGFYEKWEKESKLINLNA